MSEILQFETKTGLLTVGNLSVPFGWGKNGTTPESLGCEGDGKTPLGYYQLRFGFYRADRLPKPQSALTFHALRPDDGWCDAPDHPAYNRYVQRPFGASHEKLWREDGAYDVILVMSHNDSPPIPSRGSAVFIHCRQPDHRPTLGCLALGAPDMARLIPHLFSRQSIRID